MIAFEYGVCFSLQLLWLWEFFWQKIPLSLEQFKTPKTQIWDCQVCSLKRKKTPKPNPLLILWFPCFKKINIRWAVWRLSSAVSMVEGKDEKNQILIYFLWFFFPLWFQLVPYEAWESRFYLQMGQAGVYRNLYANIHRTHPWTFASTSEDVLSLYDKLFSAPRIAMDGCGAATRYQT